MEVASLITTDFVLVNDTFAAIGSTPILAKLHSFLISLSLGYWEESSVRLISVYVVEGTVAVVTILSDEVMFFLQY